MSRADDYIIEAQLATRNLWDSINKLAQLRSEWQYGDYFNNLGAQITLTEHPSVADISAVINVSAGALESLMDAGHGTNISKLL